VNGTPFAENRRERQVRWVDWTLLTMTASGAMLIHPFFRRLPLIVEDLGLCMLLLGLVASLAIALWRIRTVVKERNMRQWKFWTSIGGCVALSAAFVIPLIAVNSMSFFWTDWPTLWLAASGMAFFLGALAAKPSRFPLMLGGLGMLYLIIVLPRGVL
jgi:hypothetical protein